MAGSGPSRTDLQGRSVIGPTFLIDLDDRQFNGMAERFR